MVLNKNNMCFKHFGSKSHLVNPSQSLLTMANLNVNHNCKNPKKAL